ncbi:MAG: aminopeptidase N [Deltaproteobacteria bacterium]|nr:aminopeptidase N [Deltaproteobacteria bacterium]
MKTVHKIKYLKDYRPTPYRISHVDLVFDLFPDYTDVVATMKVNARPDGAQEPLVLHGRDLELQGLSLNGVKLGPDSYRVDDEFLTIPQPPSSPFELTVKNRIRPQLNTNLEGLYVSQGIFCTQCEPEGFRRITYFYDRPDNMATFKVKIQADQAYPLLLSNGNFHDKGSLPGNRHWVTWDDPFPKPSYLFALVAGKLSVLEDSFTTCSGKKVELAIYTDSQNLAKCKWAMECLKWAMAWDEKTYGLECDLDHYKIVAVRDFNMGAMENKGLNIFNSSLVFASPESTTDSEFQYIASVIGHEYFHNWTGNRVTCRDWFQLCLKEGLTVFRDHRFSEDIGSSAVHRIEQLKRLRQYQFPEDDGPIAHAPRPDQFMEINNFYTTTIYEKGAELVRILELLIGKETFRKGMDLYFKRHDGQAVTQEDFVQAMADASERDLTQFMLWYTQAGAPHVTVEEEYDASSQTYKLNLAQAVPESKGQGKKKPLHIPILMGLYSPSGDALPLHVNGQSLGTEAVLEFREEKESFTFTKVKDRPHASLFRKSSAPVRLLWAQSDKDLVFLMKYEKDEVLAWDISQKLYTNEILRLVGLIREGRTPQVSTPLLEAFGSLLKKETSDPAFKAYVLSIPSFDLVAQQMEVIDPEALHQARMALHGEFAKSYKEHFSKLYERNKSSDPGALDNLSIGKRQLKNVCLHYLSCLKNKESLAIVVDQFHKAKNMTETYAALRELANWETPEREKALEHFYNKWNADPTVIDSWFSVQAHSHFADTFDKVCRLHNHKAFDAKNPNRLRSLVSAFCKGNQLRFHDASGKAYRYCREQVISIDSYNHLMAAGLVRAFAQWRRFSKERQDLMRAELAKIQTHEGLSKDVYELVTKILA